MTSSSNIPHIYSNYAEFVSAKDWNAVQALRVSTLIDDTDSPYDLPISVGVLVVDTDAGDVIVNLPAGGQHGVKIKNIGSGTVTLVPDGVETIEDANVYASESADLEFSNGWYWT